MFSKKDDPDLCLIPINFNKNMHLKAAKINHHSCSVTTPLFNVVFNKYSIFYSKCDIVSSSQSDYQINCRQRPGYSGSGYFNHKGELCGIHRSLSKSNFLNEEFQKNSDYILDEMPQIEENEKIVLIGEMYNSIKDADFSNELLLKIQKYLDQVLSDIINENSPLYHEFISHSIATFNAIFETAIVVFRKAHTLVVDASYVYDLIYKPNLVKKVLQSTES